MNMDFYIFIRQFYICLYLYKLSRGSCKGTRRRALGLHRMPLALHVDELIQKPSILGSKRQELQPLPKRMPICKMAEIYTMLKKIMKF